MGFLTFLIRFLLKNITSPPSILPTIQVSLKLMRDSYVMIVHPKEKCLEGLVTFLNVLLPVTNLNER